MNLNIDMPDRKPQPFVKWVGGKRQLLPVIDKNLPSDIDSLTTYVEPFLGGGAVLFHMISSYNFTNVIVGDFNKELINAYLSIRDHLEPLKEILGTLENQYYALPGKEERKEFYLQQRTIYNQHINLSRDEIDLMMSSLFIFLNRTCFNGLYRVNSRGLFNVPFGDYSNPKILNADNLDVVSATLQKVNFYVGPYQDSRQFITSDVFLYLDPPYRPLSNTAAFTSYTSSPFNDSHQTQLQEFLHEVDSFGAKFMMSNSDPKNSDPLDDFFDDLYDWGHIQRVLARRNINSDASKRGSINELIITNYLP